MMGALTASEFQEALTLFPRMSQKGRQVARGVLVEGKSFAEMTEKYNTSRQLVHQWASRLYEAFRPVGWVTEMVTLPPDVMLRVRQLELAERAKWRKTIKPTRPVRR